MRQTPITRTTEHQAPSTKHIPACTFPGATLFFVLGNPNITLGLPRELLKRVKRLASDRDTSVSAGRRRSVSVSTATSSTHVRTRRAGVLLLALFVCASATLGASDEWVLRALHHLEVFNWGDTLLRAGSRANDRIPNDLAHQIHAYLSLHRVTRDSTLIDLAARQLDVVANSTDTVYRGGRGWATSRYSQNLLLNSSLKEPLIDAAVPVWNDSFETAGADATLPRSWQRVQSSAETAYLGSGMGVNGSAAAVLRTDGRNWTSLEIHRTDLKPNTYYVVEVDAASDSDLVRPNMDARTESTWFPTFHLPGSAFAAPGQWSRLRLGFKTSPAIAAGVRIRLVVSSYAAGATLRFDNFALLEATSVRPARWFKLLGHPSNVTVVNEGVRITNDGTDWQTLGQKLNNPYVADNAGYEPSATYHVRFAARTSSASTYAVATVYDWTTGATLKQATLTTPVFGKGEVQFKAPSEPGHNLWLLIYAAPYAAAGAWVELRDVTVQQLAGHVIDEALTVNALLAFSSAVEADGSLQATHGERAGRYLRLAETVVAQWNQDWVEHEDYGVFRYADDGAAGIFARATVPTNYYTEAGVSYIRLHRLTGNPEYLRKAALLARALRRALKFDNGVLAWNYYQELLPSTAPKAATISSQLDDVGHANATVQFMVEAHRAGIEFTAVDMANLSDLFVKRLWNQDIAVARIAVGLAGTRADERVPSLWDWLLLCDFDSRVLAITVAALSDYPLITTGTPIHDYLGLWYDQGWRVQLKAYVAEQIQRHNSVANGSFADGMNSWERHDFEGVASAEGGYLSLGVSGTTRWNVVRQRVQAPSEPAGYRPSAKYLVQLRSRIVGNNRGLLFVWDRRTNTILGRVLVSGPAWKRYQFSFVAPNSPGSDLFLALQATDRSAVSTAVEVDDVLVLRADRLN